MIVSKWTINIFIIVAVVDENAHIFNKTLNTTIQSQQMKKIKTKFTLEPGHSAVHA